MRINICVRHRERSQRFETKWINRSKPNVSREGAMAVAGRTFLAESSKEFFTAEPSHLSIFTGLSSIFHCNRDQME